MSSLRDLFPRQLDLVAELVLVFLVSSWQFVEFLEQSLELLLSKRQEKVAQTAKNWG